MWLNIRKKITKMDNRGSALLTVVLVTTFLTILATILMYISGLNYQNKQEDYRNKKNFYKGEVALEEIKVELMLDIAEATYLANQDIAVSFADLQSADLRHSEYNRYFVTRLQEVWDTKLAAYGGVWNDLLQSYMPGEPGYTLIMDPSYDANGNGILTSDEILDVDEFRGAILLHGIKVRYTDPDSKLTTEISTDFRITAPAFDWSDSNSRTELEAGVTVEQAKEKDLITPDDCIIYTNWKKE